jgi:hypothetical protein
MSRNVVRIALVVLSLAGGLVLAAPGNASPLPGGPLAGNPLASSPLPASALAGGPHSGSAVPGSLAPGSLAPGSPVSYLTAWLKLWLGAWTVPAAHGAEGGLLSRAATRPSPGAAGRPRPSSPRSAPASETGLAIDPNGGNH